jgi:hypothetical protein
VLAQGSGISPNPDLCADTTPSHHTTYHIHDSGWHTCVEEALIWHRVGKPLAAAKESDPILVME